MTNKANMNPMKFHPRFSHITDQIFEKLDKKSHGSKMLIQKSKGFNIDLNAKDGRTAFHSACDYGGLKTVERLILKSKEFKIDLNAKENDWRTAFHNARL